MSDYQRALSWYERLRGFEPAFIPNATEAVWELSEHRYLDIEELPERAGYAPHTVFVDDFDERVESPAKRVDRHAFTLTPQPRDLHAEKNQRLRSVPWSTTSMASSAPPGPSDVVDNFGPAGCRDYHHRGRVGDARTSA